MSITNHFARINAQCPGYSTELHWKCLTKLVSDPTISRILVLGVYMGRDVAYLAQMLKGRPHHIVGVDKFSDTPCNDWPAEKQGMGWEEACYGKPPSLELAQKNLKALGLSENVELVQSTAEDYLRVPGEPFCVVYIDTSHDRQTTLETIRLAVPRVRPGGIIAGDDYENLLPTWDVSGAVAECFGNDVEVVGGTFWRAKVEAFKG